MRRDDDVDYWHDLDAENEVYVLAGDLLEEVREMYPDLDEGDLMAEAVEEAKCRLDYDRHRPEAVYY